MDMMQYVRNTKDMMYHYIQYLATIPGYLRIWGSGWIPGSGALDLDIRMDPRIWSSGWDHMIS
jgi:hypothetical protein